MATSAGAKSGRRAVIASGIPFFSFEFSAARDPEPADLFSRIRRMHKREQPLWVDVTWGFGDVGRRSIAAARHVRKEINARVLMHFICTDKTTAELERHLQAARDAGVRSILALRGYTQAGFDSWQPCSDGDGTEPQHADALVRFIKERHEDFFSIGVAGFPEGHPESSGDLEADVQRLKGKIDAGAEFIICQFCFDPAVFAAFLGRCRTAGIKVPIIPGVMPLTEYSTARLLSDTWGVSLPPSIEVELRECEATCNHDRARSQGEDFTVDMCVELLSLEESSHALHFFVYDAEWEVTRILERLRKRGALPQLPDC